MLLWILAGAGALLLARGKTLASMQQTPGDTPAIGKVAGEQVIAPATFDPAPWAPGFRPSLAQDPRDFIPRPCAPPTVATQIKAVATVGAVAGPDAGSTAVPAGPYTSTPPLATYAPSMLAGRPGS